MVFPYSKITISSLAAFSHLAPVLWNQFPADLRLQSDLSKNLKALECLFFMCFGKADIFILCNNVLLYKYSFNGYFKYYRLFKL